MGNYIGMSVTHRILLCSRDMLTSRLTDAGKGEQSDFSDEDDSEDGYDLRDVSSDVEVDPNELDMLSDDEEYVSRIHPCQAMSDVPQPVRGDRRRASEGGF